MKKQEVFSVLGSVPLAARVSDYDSVYLLATQSGRLMRYYYNQDGFYETKPLKKYEARWFYETLPCKLIPKERVYFYFD